MPDTSPSLYETLLQNFTGELPLHQVPEPDQQTLSILDNLQRILNTRAGALAHLPDYGLPDMGTLLQGLPGSAQALVETLGSCLLKDEPRLAALRVELLAQSQPGHLQYSLQAQLHDGTRASFATLIGGEGRVLVRHLKRQGCLAGPGAGQ